MTASLGLWISFSSMLTFHPEFLGFAMNPLQWTKETLMRTFYQIFKFSSLVSLKK